MAISPQTRFELLDDIERELDLSADELAGALGVSVPTLRRWRANGSPVEVDMGNRLSELDAVRRCLHETFLPEAIPVWLRTPNRYLRGRTPADALRTGNLDGVKGALGNIDSGIFT